MGPSPPRAAHSGDAETGDHRAEAADPVGEDCAVALILTKRPCVELLAAVAHRLLGPGVRGDHKPSIDMLMSKITLLMRSLRMSRSSWNFATAVPV